MIDQCFSTYVYSDFVVREKLALIQEELYDCFKTLKENDKFKKKWTDETHSLSDATFSQNLIKEYKLELFEEELNNHIQTYLDNLNYPHKKEFRIVSSWMTLNKKGESSRMHHHGSADISGVYYIQTLGLDGDLYFHTPVNMWASSYLFSHLHNDLYAKPEIGKLFLFPSGLLHGVAGNVTNSERVSISFNVELVRDSEL